MWATSLCRMTFCLLIVATAFGTGYRVTLEEIYSRQKVPAGFAALSPEGRYLYVSNASRTGFQVIEWSSNRVISSVDFSAPARSSRAEELRGRFEWLDTGYGNQFALMRFGSSVYRIEMGTWQLLDKIADIDSSFRGLSAAPDGRMVLLGRGRQRDTLQEVSIFRTNDWKLLGRWMLPNGQKEFTPDGHTFVIKQFYPRGHRANDKKACRMDFYEAPSGKHLRSVDFLEQGGECPESPSYFHPAEPHLLVSKGFVQGGISFWDTNSGRLVKRIAGGIRLADLTISPDGRWIFGTIWDRDSAIEQDFGIWDGRTGALVYQKNARPALSREGRSSAQFSSDGQHLLLASANRLTIYRVQPKGIYPRQGGSITEAR